MKAAKIDTTIAFLKSHGWSLKKNRNVRFYLLYPPKEIQSEEPLIYRIPKTEVGKDFKEYMLHIVISIADLYEVNKWELLDLLSKSLPQIQQDLEAQLKEIEMKQRLLAFAS